jgi:hypothetical protein
MAEQPLSWRTKRRLRKDRAGDRYRYRQAGLCVLDRACLIDERERLFEYLDTHPTLSRSDTDVLPRRCPVCGGKRWYGAATPPWYGESTPPFID